MHAPNRTEPWIEVTRRNEVMLLLPFDTANGSESLVNFDALTPPFDFTPPRKPHVHPYPPDGFIPQAGAFAPV